ncbi:radical SAM protein [Candidatus Woesearchaeota archaeon CG10_big_fil_rev_8_21_14_0_10_36_11]|nr:MAG: radical SAM protein [Candidatus Woesearchaeota archaeon CG10_big_fil_rev_8_21_14_0_10_36_11]
MRYTILDCYTDEASGLGVPPYLGTYPRYIYGKLTSEGHDVTYLTIDDVRLWRKYKNVKKEPSVKEKTNILVYNTTKNSAEKVFSNTDTLIVVLGVHVPGKYLSALPGTLQEVISLLHGINVHTILTGPAVLGTQLEGGKFFEKVDLNFFDDVKDFTMSFDDVGKIVTVSASILTQIPSTRVIEIETSRGCNVGKCSFCTEPLKNCFVNRSKSSVVKEVKAFYNAGARHFRLGKQADFYSSDDPIGMLKDIRKNCPAIEVLHIDNANPNSVLGLKGEAITKAIVEYCTPGNIAALGVESFDPVVVKANVLNTSPLVALKAIKIINKYGAERGENGMHKFLPGINIIFGLIDESKQTHTANINALQTVLDENLLLRRINIRQVSVFPGTLLEKKAGNKFVRKNKQYYWKWRNEIRQKIDFPMLQRLVPVGTVLSEVYTEMYDGKTTFCRQYGTYPLIIGVKGRLPLKEKIKIKVVDHMLRSIVGEVVE